MAEKILVVDDDLDTLRLVGLMLQRQGYEIVAATNGHQALKLAQSEHPDLILLDVMMPDLDGVEVTRRLRIDEVTKDLPIIMFTAKTQMEDKLLGFEAGVDDYLTKPTQPRELFAHIKAVLARSGKSRPVTAALAERAFSIGVLSTRGGLGVTTLALNLGIALFDANKKSVIVTDFRPGQGTLGQELGYLNCQGFTRLLQRKPNEIDTRSIEAEMIAHVSGVRLLLSSSQPHDALYMNAIANFDAISRRLVYMSRYVVLDLGPSLPPLSEKILQQCDEIMLVTEPVPQTLLQTKILIDDLVAKGIGEGRIDIVLVNRVRSGIQLSWSQAQEQLGRSIAAIFTSAPELAYQASLNNVPMVIQQPDSLTAQQFAKLAEKVVQRSR
ncbi:MAG TPA: response regulator [Anaerolineales bacterium]